MLARDSAVRSGAIALRSWPPIDVLAAKRAGSFVPAAPAQHASHRAVILLRYAELGTDPAGMRPSPAGLSNAMKILLIEDAAKLAGLPQRGLAGASHAVDAEYDGEAAKTPRSAAGTRSSCSTSCCPKRTGNCRSSC
jgi:hypothetical protein